MLSAELYLEIPLTQGKVALVSARHYEELSKHKWRAQWTQHSKGFYAVRSERLPDGKRVSQLMHRQILGLPYGDKRQGDHINHDTLNNRDENLRIATHAENQHNRGKTSNNTSGFKGVSRNGKGWEARIWANGKHLCLGTRDTPQQASELYCTAATKFHGKFARVTTCQ